jgi:uncharacterized phiE125 gp8 family phage protein
MLKCVDSTRTAPEKEPVLLEELKEQLRIDYTDHDPELQHLITEARLWAEENELGRCLITQTVTEKFRTLDGVLELRFPASSITSLSYVDDNGTTQTLATTYYELGQYYGISVCRLKYDQTWPTTRDQNDAVTIVYVAGYGSDRDDIPLPIRQAIKCYACYRYDESEYPQLLQAARRLLGPYSVRR